MYIKTSCKEMEEFRHRAGELHTKQDFEKGAHTQTSPTPLFRFVFCVLSFITGTLRMSVDKRPTVSTLDAGFFW